MDSPENLSASFLQQTNQSTKEIDGTSYILANRLMVGYAKEVIVPDISFDLKRGQAMGLIGTNGSGKSTLLKTIVGLLPLMGGQLSIFGETPGSNHQRIAYLGQFHASGFVLPIQFTNDKCHLSIIRLGFRMV